MGQVLFQSNIPSLSNNLNAIIDGSLSFFPLNIYDSISLKTVNIAINAGGTTKTVSFYLGLYSLSISTLSLANSLSATYTQAGADRFISLTDTSANQNITPGTWFWGILVNFSSSSNVSLYGGLSDSPGNAFPGGFIGGSMTESTAALPASYATSNLGVTGKAALFNPLIIISS